ncbi:unnamed protein product [Symbiodinium microadriaticum]|nr:unnamed protein product [Symbiodinium microadriaticum]
MDWMEVEMTSAFLEDLPPTEQFDSIVFGNVLCEVPCQKDFFRAVDAHLKPGGRVYFSEHVLSEFPLLRLLQHAVSPAWPHGGRQFQGGIGSCVELKELRYVPCLREL